jgi:hypothetical protein
MPKRNPRGNAPHQREKQKQSLAWILEEAASPEDPTYLDTETDADFVAALPEPRFWCRNV